MFYVMRRIMLDMKIKNLFDLLTKLYDMGYRMCMVVGADRINGLSFIKKYNAKKASMVSITLETST